MPGAGDSNHVLPDEAEVRRRVERIRQLAQTGEMELVGQSGGDPVSLAAASPTTSTEWPARFAEIRVRLARALGPAVVRIDHVGSTAVPWEIV